MRRLGDKKALQDGEESTEHAHREGRRVETWVRAHA